MHLDDVPREVLAALAASGALYAFSTTVRRRLRRHRMRRRFARAAEGEREASRLLEEQGFAIEAAQAVTCYPLDVDGAQLPVEVRADYLVSRGGETFVAEVKTGRLAPRLETSATRRQLLEYQHAFGATGVVLVDADARSVRLVSFVPAIRPRRSRPLLWLAAALAVAAVSFLVDLR